MFLGAGLSLADVYIAHVVGDGAYGVANYEALPNQVIRKPRGSGGATGDPLDQVGSIGWKGSHAAVILDQARQVVIETSAAGGAFG